MKKRSIKEICTLIFSIIIYSMTILSFFSAAVHADTIDNIYNTTNANITVTYHEIPVNILSYNLSDTSTGKIFNAINLTPLDGITWGYYIFNFTTVYLPNSDYRFIVRGMATDNTINVGTKDFKIDHPEMAVWLISPPVGIGATPNYDIVVGTQFPATCKWSLSDFDASCNNDLLCMYSRAPSQFDITNNVVSHTLHYSSSSTFRFMYVICYNPSEIDLTKAFGTIIFNVGYLSTGPHITSLNATNNPIVSLSDKTTVINAVTDQSAVCRLTGGNANNPYNKWNDSYFTAEDPTMFTSYTTQHAYYLDFWNIANIFSRLDFNYNVTCYNYAQLTDKKNYDLIYNLSSNVIITSLMPQYLPSSVNYQIRTSIADVVCQLYLDGVSKGTMTPVESDPTIATHYILNGLQLHSGTNNVNVTCTYQKDYSAVFTHMIDEIPPIMNITTTSTSSCGLSRFTFGFQGYDNVSGIAYYNYTITFGGTTAVDWTKTTSTSITYNPGTLQPGTYSINAKAYDNAGNSVDAAPLDILAVDATDISCDRTNPVAHVTLVSSTQYQESVNVSCTDNLGCTNNFGYYFADGNTQYNCANTSYTQMSYSSNPQVFTGVGKLCIIVFDQNNNNATAESVITLSQAQCGNNKIDNAPELNYFEKCDGTDLGNATCNLFGFNGGILGCAADCQDFDTRNCNVTAGYCGDNKIDNNNLEQCDGTDWGHISTCRDFNFTGGTLKCGAPFAQDQCMFNTSQCTPSIVLPKQCNAPTSQIVLDSGEQCENSKGLSLGCSAFDSFFGGPIFCTQCNYDISQCYAPSVCGDGKITAPEVCEGNTSEPCSTLDSNTYQSGTATCNQCSWNTSQCIVKGFCGNGQLEDSELCDGTALRGITCTDLGYKNGILRCSSDCQSYDESNCGGNATGYCGDGKLQEPDGGGIYEQCDGNTATNASWGRIRTCQNFNFTAGTLGCYGTNESIDLRCRFDTSRCIPKATPAPAFNCGDKILAAGEQCENTQTALPLNCSNFDGFDSGTISCDACFYNLAACRQPVVPVCGDSIKQGSEDCDGSDWGNISSCNDFLGMDGGTLSCNSQCHFNLSQCTSQAICGNTILDNGEQCDLANLGGKNCSSFTFTGGILGCNAPGSSNQCQWNTSSCTTTGPSGYCGDGRLNPGEKCDGSVANANEWATTLNCTGTIYCSSNCTIECTTTNICGDSIIQKPNDAGLNEQCDGSQLGSGMNCNFFDNFTGGILRCFAAGSTNECKWNTKDCNAGHGYCGDNKIETPLGEQCDGTDWGKIHGCSDFGFQGGSLSCSPSGTGSECRFDTSRCITPPGKGECGDGVLNTGEQCESNLPFTLGCLNFDNFTGGTMQCSSCMYDFSQCTAPVKGYCGDSNVDPGETCDAEGSTRACESFPGFTGGDAVCHSCQYDVSQCKPSPVCGNNNTEGTEQCDGFDLGMMSCNKFDDFTGGLLSCYPQGNSDECTFNLGNCNGGTTGGQCGDGIINDFPNEQCDGSNLGSTTQCSQLNSRFVSGALSCNAPGADNQCKYDLSACVQKQPVCGNGVIEDKELCDGSIIGLLTCNTFGFDYGILGCNAAGSIDQCKPDTTLCVGNSTGGPNNPPELNCGDGIIEPGEQCDGSNLGSTDWSQVSGYTDCSVTCNQCNIECATGSGGGLPAHCTDAVKDADETDLNCGGSCDTCLTGSYCLSNNDCASSNCQDNLCVQGSGPPPSDNVTTPCTATSCGKGVCIDGVCKAKPANTTALIILMFGILLTLASGGYIIYMTYFAKKEPEQPLEILHTAPEQRPIDTRVIAMQHEKAAQKQAEKDIQRRSLLKDFDSVPAKPDEITKIAEKPGKAVQKDYIEVTELNKKALASTGSVDQKKDVFAKLKNISEGKPAEKPISQQAKPAKSVKQETRKPKIQKSRSKKPVFEKLDTVSANYSSKELASKVSELSGKPIEKVTTKLNAEKVDSAMFSSMDRDALLSPDFKKVLKDMLGSGKIDADSVKKMMFNYVIEGVLSKREVAKLFEELKLI